MWLQKLQTELRETMSMHVDNVRELMSEVARNQSLLVDTLNSTVNQTLDTGKPLRTSPYIALNKHFNLFARSVI